MQEIFSIFNCNIVLFEQYLNACALVAYRFIADTYDPLKANIVALTDLDRLHQLDLLRFGYARYILLSNFVTREKTSPSGCLKKTL